MPEQRRIGGEAFLATLVRGGAPPAVLLLTGPESCTKEKIQRLLEAKLVEAEALSLNVVRISGAEIRYADVVMTARTMPMMSRFRLLILSEMQDVRDRDHDVLIDYLKAPSPTTCLVVDAEGADLRRQPFVAIAKAATVVECKALSVREAESFVAGYARERGITLDGPAAALLVERVGSDMTWLKGEVERLILYVHPAPSVELPAVEAVVGRSRERSVFEYVAALSRRDLDGAVCLLRDLVADGEAPLGILALIERQFRMMLTAAEVLERGATPADACRSAGVPPFLTARFLAELKSWRPDVLRAAYPRFLRKDQDMKSRGVSPLAELELLSAELCGP